MSGSLHNILTGARRQRMTRPAFLGRHFRERDDEHPMARGAAGFRDFGAAAGRHCPGNNHPRQGSTALK